MVWKFSFTNGTVGYTGHKAFSIKNINFELKSGDILGLIGQSGSGKSTLIKTLLGLNSPLAGVLKLYSDDKDIDLKGTVGYSPQENALYDSLTIDENCYTFAQLHSIPKATYLEQKKELYAVLKLEAAATKVISQLSGGMQKRADLAVALIHNPQIIILDEPFNGLDASLQDFIWTFILTLSKDGKIVIISSHMLPDLEKNCTKLGFIHKGEYYGDALIKKRLKESRVHLVDYAKEIFK